MKRFLVLCFVLMIAGISYGFNFNATPPSKSTIVRTTLTTAETVYPVTFTAGDVVLYSLHASEEVRRYLTGSSTEVEYITIPANTIYQSQNYIKIAKNTSWYFRSAVSNEAVEILYYYF